MLNGRTLSLTPELVARVHRAIDDSGPLPGFGHLTEDEYDGLVERTFAESARPDEVHLFACGSLIWRPACATDAQEPALLHGWHRSYCLRIRRFRGTMDRPGLMMGLDRGGACRGVVQRIAGPDVKERLGLLVRREASVKPMTQAPRWVTVETASGRRRAIAICIDRSGPSYCRHTPDETAEILAEACGHWGSCAEYLMNTVHHLEELGIHDRYLWRVQELVAARIRALP